MNIGELFVRITADPSGVKKGTAEASASLNSFSGVVAKVGGVVAGLFAANEIENFISSSITAAKEADVIWNRLGGTLRNAGVNFASARGEIERMANELENTSTVGDEEFAATLQTLVRISGDYRASLNEVATVADLAAGAQISLETAATLVGKVMVGETGTLKRYGIVVGEGADAMQLLRDRFRGMAENEGNTLEGQVIRLNNEWGNFKEAIGNALSGGNGMIGFIRNLSTYLENATTNLTALVGHLRELHGWLSKTNGLLNTFGMGFKGILSGPATIGGLDTSLFGGAHQPKPVDPLIPDDAVSAMESLATSFRSLPDFIELQNLPTVQDNPFRVTATGHSIDLVAAEAAAAWAIWFREAEIAVAEAQNRADRRANSPLAKAGNMARDVGGSILGGLANIFNPMAMAGQLVNSVLQRLGPEMDKLMVALEPIVRILVAVLTPVINFLAGAITRAVNVVLWWVEMYGRAIRFVGELLNKLPGSLGNPLVKAGQAAIDFAAKTREGMKAQDKATDSMNKLSESVLGAVNGFKTAGYRHSATIPSGGAGVGAAGVSPPTGSIIVPVTIQTSGGGEDTYSALYHEIGTRARGRAPSDPFRAFYDAMPSPI